MRGPCGVALVAAGSGTVLVSKAGASGREGVGSPPCGLAHWRIPPLVSQPKYLAPKFPPAEIVGLAPAASGAGDFADFPAVGVFWHDEYPRASDHILKMAHQSVSPFSSVFGTSKPVGPAPDQIGRQLLNLMTTGRATPERLLTVLSGVPALRKFPVATKQLASSPGLGERILKLVTTRAKRGELVSDEELLGLIESQARAGIRR